MIFLDISTLIFMVCGNYLNTVYLPADRTISKSERQHIVFISKNQKERSDAETDIIGRWTSNDGNIHIHIDDTGRVIEQGQEVGKVVLPCCGNFGFRRRNEEAIYKYDNCIYWLSFSKDKNISGWYKLPDYKINNCPTGIFRRDE